MSLQNRRILCKSIKIESDSETKTGRNSKRVVCVCFDCVALTTRTMLKGCLTLVPTENDFLYHVAIQQLVRQTRNLA